MAIVVKHSGNAAPTLVGAYGAGQGKRWAEDARQRLDIAARAEEATRQRNFQERQAVLQRRQQRRMQNDSQRYDSRQRELDRAWRSGEAETAEERAISRTRLAADLGSDAREQEFGLRDDLAGREQERRRDDIEWNYTTKQRQDFSRMNDTLEEARTSGDFTDDEMKDLEQQAYTKLVGLEPVPAIKKRSPFPEGQQPGQTWVSEDGNFLLTRDDKGNLKKLGELNQRPTFSDRVSAWKQASELSKEPVLDSKGRPTDQMRVNPKKVKKLVQEILGTQDYGGADPGAVQRWGVGSGGDEDDDAEVDDSTDDSKKKSASPADRWAI